LYSRSYIRSTDQAQSYGKVYDTGDPQKPFDKEWFEVKNRKTRWGGTCRYATEHILEWQLLQDFIEGDKGQGSNSRCAHLQEWFLGSMPTSAYKVKVAKNDGELQKDNHFEYEDKDYGFGGFKFEAQNPRYIDWIGKCYRWLSAKESLLGWPQKRNLGDHDELLSGNAASRSTPDSCSDVPFPSPYCMMTEPS
jgi:hypothetical protein